jgi:hypothetical protein
LCSKYTRALTFEEVCQEARANAKAVAGRNSGKSQCSGTFTVSSHCRADFRDFFCCARDTIGQQKLAAHVEKEKATMNEFRRMMGLPLEGE